MHDSKILYTANGSESSFTVQPFWVWVGTVGDPEQFNEDYFWKVVVILNGSEIQVASGTCKDQNQDKPGTVLECGKLVKISGELLESGAKVKVFVDKVGDHSSVGSVVARMVWKAFGEEKPPVATTETPTETPVVTETPEPTKPTEPTPTETPTEPIPSETPDPSPTPTEPEPTPTEPPQEAKTRLNGNMTCTSGVTRWWYQYLTDGQALMTVEITDPNGLKTSSVRKVAGKDRVEGSWKTPGYVYAKIHVILNDGGKIEEFDGVVDENCGGESAADVLFQTGPGNDFHESPELVGEVIVGTIIGEVSLPIPNGSAPLMVVGLNSKNEVNMPWGYAGRLPGSDDYAFHESRFKNFKDLGVGDEMVLEGVRYVVVDKLVVEKDEVHAITLDHTTAISCTPDGWKQNIVLILQRDVRTDAL